MAECSAVGAAPLRDHVQKLLQRRDVLLGPRQPHLLLGIALLLRTYLNLMGPLGLPEAVVPTVDEGRAVTLGCRRLSFREMLYILVSERGEV